MTAWLFSASVRVACTQGYSLSRCVAAIAAAPVDEMGVVHVPERYVMTWRLLNLLVAVSPFGVCVVRCTACLDCFSFHRLLRTDERVSKKAGSGDGGSAIQRLSNSDAVLCNEMEGLMLLATGTLVTECWLSCVSCMCSSCLQLNATRQSQLRRLS